MAFDDSFRNHQQLNQVCSLLGDRFDDDRSVDALPSSNPKTSSPSTRADNLIFPSGPISVQRTKGFTNQEVSKEVPRGLRRSDTWINPS